MECPARVARSDAVPIAPDRCQVAGNPGKGFAMRVWVAVLKLGILRGELTCTGEAFGAVSRQLLHPAWVTAGRATGVHSGVQRPPARECPH
ncbi:hypothetical protein GCM10009863_13690 [Streptomyces axinellae]|uniref:Uncharacterized protein n=1 Tax=Streptomyces axinellae TaxID=552788 RepID=A0ABN3PTE5_9ACTN